MDHTIGMTEGQFYWWYLLTQWLIVVGTVGAVIVALFGEQWSLKWSQIDLGPTPRLTLPKTKNGNLRHIPLNVTACRALEALRKAGEGSEHVCPRQWYRVWFERALVTAKIEEFTWHCLRHTFISRLVMAGVDLRTVAELAGHKTLQMTMRYAHLSPKHSAEAISRLDGFATDTKTSTAVSGSL